MNYYLVSLLISFLLVNLVVPKDPTWDADKAYDKIKDYTKIMESLLKLAEEGMNLHEKCENLHFNAITALHFSGAKLTFDQSEGLDYEEGFFSNIKKFEESDKEHFVMPKELPNKAKFPNLREFFLENFKNKNPWIYENQAIEWQNSLNRLVRFLSQCNSKDNIFNHEFIRKYDKQGIENVTFYPRQKNQGNFSFSHSFVGENNDFSDDARMPSSLTDALKYIEKHFVGRLKLPTSIPSSETSSENIEIRNPFGFQILWNKEERNFNVLRDITLRGDIHGNLLVYVFEGNGKLKDMETLRNIRTEGEALITLSEININLNDKDVILFDVEGEGTLAKTGTYEHNTGVAVNGMVIVNKHIPAWRFKNPKVGMIFDLEGCGYALDGDLELARKEESGKRKSPVVLVRKKEENYGY